MTRHLRRLWDIRAHSVCVYMHTQSCPALCSPTDCSPAGSSVHGILQARGLEWVAISCSRGSSQPRDRTRVSGVSCIAGGFFGAEPPGLTPRCHIPPGAKCGTAQRENLFHSLVMMVVWSRLQKLQIKQRPFQLLFTLHFWLGFQPSCRQANLQGYWEVVAPRFIVYYKPNGMLGMKPCFPIGFSRSL